MLKGNNRKNRSKYPIVLHESSYSYITIITLDRYSLISLPTKLHNTKPSLHL